jgi:hypothetical protein
MSGWSDLDRGLRRWTRDPDPVTRVLGWINYFAHWAFLLGAGVGIPLLTVCRAFWWVARGR